MCVIFGKTNCVRLVGKDGRVQGTVTLTSWDKLLIHPVIFLLEQKSYQSYGRGACMRVLTVLNLRNLLCKMIYKRDGEMSQIWTFLCVQLANKQRTNLLSSMVRKNPPRKETQPPEENSQLWEHMLVIAKWEVIDTIFCDAEMNSFSPWSVCPSGEKRKLNS